jgi:hypothetical protein
MRSREAFQADIDTPDVSGEFLWAICCIMKESIALSVLRISMNKSVLFN